MRALAAVLIALATTGALAQPAHAGTSQPPAPATAPTIVLVHGAFADASSWHPVIDELADEGYDVLAPANPLRGVDVDAQYLRDFLASVAGPIVLVGHSYGGFVVTNAATGNANVEALVYIAAFAPDAGETVASISASVPGSLLGPDTLTIRPYTGADGNEHLEGYIAVESYAEVFAGDVDPDLARTFAVSQKPADLAILEAPSGDPAWATIPAWTLVATDDLVIPADAQRSMAARANATTVEVEASHSVAVSNPETAAALIVDAAATIA